MILIQTIKFLLKLVPLEKLTIISEIEEEASCNKKSSYFINHHLHILIGKEPYLVSSCSCQVSFKTVLFLTGIESDGILKNHMGKMADDCKTLYDFYI